MRPVLNLVKNVAFQHVAMYDISHVLSANFALGRLLKDANARQTLGVGRAKWRVRACERESGHDYRVVDHVGIVLSLW